MHKHVLFLFSAVFLLALMPVAFAQLFEEPSDLYWRVSIHTPTTFPCPQNNSYTYYRELAQSKGAYYNSFISDEDIELFIEQCSGDSRFFIDAAPLSAEVQSCMSSLGELVDSGPDKDSSRYERDIKKECLVREHNKNASSLQRIIAERDSVLLETVVKKRDNPRMVDIKTSDGKVITQHKYDGKTQESLLDRIKSWLAGLL